EFQLDLVQKGSDVTGTASRTDGSTDIQKGSFRDGKLSVNVEADGGEYLIQGTLDGDKLAGTLTHSSGVKAPWEGTRGAAASASSTANPVGQWKIRADAGDHPVEATLSIKEDAKKLTGTIALHDGELQQLNDITFVDGRLTFSI